MSVGNVSSHAGYAYRNLAGPPVQRGTNAPNISQESKPTEATSSESFRVYAGDSIPSNVVLNPNQRKQLFEQGFIDVQRSSTMMESNEGLLSITGKMIGALIGPSKSVAAISIDPKFLEMIKDPNAIVGMGYTRVISENFTVLPPVNSPDRPQGVTPQEPMPPASTDFSSRPALEQTERARNERSLRLERETVQQGKAYMVEVNSSQNDPNARWNAQSTRQSAIYTENIAKYESQGAPKLWNGDLVLDATWEGAYVEAILQDRDMAVRFQFVTRGNDDMNVALRDLRGGNNSTVAVQRTNQMIDYVNKKNGTNLTLAQVRNNPQLLRDGMAQAFDMGSFANVQKIDQQARDFRATGYISLENPKVATESIGGLSKSAANGILTRQFGGTSIKQDGTRNHYDTIRMLETRSLDQPGFNLLKKDYPGAENLLDVYKAQTETTAIPDAAMDEYTAIYNRVFNQNMSVDAMKALAPPPTLKDMYALRAHEFNPGQVPVSAQGGRVVTPDTKAVSDNILNTRLVLEANNPSGNQVHWFDERAIKIVNARADNNLQGVNLNLRDNAGNVVEGGTLNRLKIQDNLQETEAHNTEIYEKKTGQSMAGGVGYGYVPTGGGGDTTSTVAFKATEAELRTLATSNEPQFRAIMSEAFGLSGAALDEQVAKAKDPAGQWSMPETTTNPNASVETKTGTPEQVTVVNPQVLTENLNTLDTLANTSQLVLEGTPEQQTAKLDELYTNISQALDAMDPNAKVTIGGKEVSVAEAKAHLEAQKPVIQANLQAGQELVDGYKEAKRAYDLAGGATGAGAVPSSGHQNIAGMPPTPNLAGAGPNRTNYYQSVKPFVEQLNQHINGLMTVGKRHINDAELATMRTNINALHQNLAQSLGMNPDTLALASQEDIGKALGIQGDYQQMSPDDKLRVDEAVAAVSFINKAHANLNLRQDGAGLAKVQQAITDLQTNTTNFDLNVTRNQFRGEMGRLAANSTAFSNVMQGAYGLDPSQPAQKTFIDRLESMARSGNMPEPPNVRFVDPQDLNGGKGAYVSEGGGTILISKALLEQKPFNPREIQNVFTEEMFHHFDHVLNPSGPGKTDTDGDEGRGGLQALRAQQSGATADAIRAAGEEGRKAVAEKVTTATTGDHGTVNIDGRSVAAEFNSGNQPYVTAPDNDTRYQDANRDGSADATNKPHLFNNADIRVTNAYATGVTHGPDHNQWSAHANMAPDGSLPGATVAANDGTGRVLNPTQEGRTLQGGEANTMNFTQGAEGDTGGKLKMTLMGAMAKLSFGLADKAFQASAAILNVWKNEYTVNLAKDTIVGDVLFDKALNLTVGLRDHQHQERAITEAKLNPDTWSTTPDYNAANRIAAARERKATQEAYLDQRTGAVDNSNARIKQELEQANKAQPEQAVSNPGVAQPKETQNA